jgi:hypothetical protein
MRSQYSKQTNQKELSWISALSVVPALQIQDRAKAKFTINAVMIAPLAAHPPLQFLGRFVDLAPNRSPGHPGILIHSYTRCLSNHGALRADSAAETSSPPARLFRSARAPSRLVVADKKR